MAPSVNLSDDVAELSRCVAQLARMALAGRPRVQLEKAAPAAGLSAEQAGAFMRGEILLPPRQSVSLANALMEQERAAGQRYMEQLRQGHAGSDVMGAGYAGRVTEKAALPRGGSEERERVTGGPAERTDGDVADTLLRLKKDFPGWKFRADGAESLAAGRAKLTWRARHPDRGDASGATSLELAGKVLRVDAAAAEEERRIAQYARG